MGEQFVAAIVVGVVVGIFSGLLGIGGGTLMIPVFRLGFGMSALTSTATSLFTIVPTSLSGCATHIKNKTCAPKIGLCAGLAGACTSPLGVLAATHSPAIAVMTCAAVIIAYSAITMFRKAISMPKETNSDLSIRAQLQHYRNAFKDEEPSDSSYSAAANSANIANSNTAHVYRSSAAATAEAELTYNVASIPEAPRGAATYIKAAAIGLFAGLASGYVGVGGGFIMVPLFISVLGISMKQASGTSLIAVVLLAIPGVITQCLCGNVDYAAGIAMAIGSIPGALIGASLVQYIPERKMRFLFGFFLLFAAIILISNELGVFA